MSSNIAAEGQRKVAGVPAGEDWQEFINRKLAANLAAEKFSSVEKSNK
jgi:hypothetical protein